LWICVYVELYSCVDVLRCGVVGLWSCVVV